MTDQTPPPPGSPGQPGPPPAAQPGPPPAARPGPPPGAPSPSPQPPPAPQPAPPYGQGQPGYGQPSYGQPAPAPVHRSPRPPLDLPKIVFIAGWVVAGLYAVWFLYTLTQDDFGVDFGDRLFGSLPDLGTGVFYAGVLLAVSVWLGKQKADG